jgi:hypothetical protein
MERVVSRVSAVGAIGLVVGLAVVSGGTIHARQNPPAQQPAPAAQTDNLLLNQGTPHLIVWAVKSTRGADFEAFWAAVQAAASKDARAEVKEFGSSIASIYKVAAAPGSAADAPVFYVFQIDKPSTQSYNPGKVVYEFLYFQKDGKEGGIPRADADAIFAKAGNMQEMFVNILVWPLTKIGS